MKTMNPFGSLTLIWVDFEMIGDMNPLDHQNIAIFFNLTCCLRGQKTFTRGNFTRFQRAAKGSG